MSTLGRASRDGPHPNPPEALLDLLLRDREWKNLKRIHFDRSFLRTWPPGGTQTSLAWRGLVGTHPETGLQSAAGGPSPGEKSRGWKARDRYHHNEAPRSQLATVDGSFPLAVPDARKEQFLPIFKSFFLLTK